MNNIKKVFMYLYKVDSGIMQFQYYRFNLKFFCVMVSLKLDSTLSISDEKEILRVFFGMKSTRFINTFNSFNSYRKDFIDFINKYKWLDW